LLKHPAQQQLLRDNPSTISGAIEEILRYEAPLQRVKRVAQTEVAIGGETIRKGQTALLLIGSANRDPDLCSDPDRFDITRAPVQHLSFAFGTHFCIGAALARMEVGIALGSLLRRFPRLRLESHEARWEKRSLFRGLETLPVSTD
jgi:cytochrome P450